MEPERWQPHAGQHWRHALIVIVLVVVTVVAFGGASAFAIYRLHRNEIQDQIEDQRRLAGVVAGQIAIFTAGMADAEAVRRRVEVFGHAPAGRLTIMAADGTVIADSEVPPERAGKLGARPEIQAARTTGFGVDERHNDALGKRLFHVAVPIRYQGRVVGYARLSRERVPVSRAVATAAPLLAYLAVAAGIVVLIGRMATGRIQRESERLIEAASAAAARSAESEQRLKEAQRVANIGSWDWDMRAQRATWSDHQFRMLGLVPDAFEPSLERCLHFVHPDDRATVADIAGRVMETGQMREADVRLIRSDGSLVFAHTRTELITAPSGEPLRMHGTILDITALKRAESARREAEEQFRAFIETTNEWVWSADTRGTLTYSNPAVYGILGYAPSELVGRDVLSFLQPEDQTAVERAVPSMIESGAAWSGIVRRWRHKNGESRYLESNGMPVFDDAGQVVGFRGSERDITPRRTAEEAARKTEERFQLAVRATNDVLWDWHIAAGSVWWSEGMRTVFGYTDFPDSVDQWSALIHPDDVEWVGETLQQFLNSARETWTQEYRFRRADASYSWVLDRGIVVRDQRGAPLRMIGSLLDLTERKEAERLKTDFVSFVSHQLRTPLAGMSWMLELAADAESLPGEAREYIHQARESAARLVSLVNDLLDIARLESGRTMMGREPIRLDEMTRSVLREMRTLIDEKRHVVTFDADGAPAAIGDPQMIRQVIGNLLSNAVKYTPERGRIDVRLQSRERRVQWQVSDNGMGIPRAAQARLFEKFFRAANAVAKDAEGTGLGLHLVRLVIEHAGGDVWCESEEGHGATFAFTLPVTQ